MEKIQQDGAYAQLTATPFCARHRAISLLLSNAPDLLEQLFNPERTCLDLREAEYLRDWGEQSRQRRLLIQLAICIWSGSATVELARIYEQLDLQEFERLYHSLRFLIAARRERCGCGLCSSSSDRFVFQDTYKKG